MPRPHLFCSAPKANATWAKDCDILLYMTTEHHAGLNTVVLTLGEKENRHFLWRKSILSWSFLYVHLLEKADWFMRADDDTYVNMDTLRTFLSGRSWKFGIWGCGGCQCRAAMK
jgi:hypothetical protein